MHKSVKKFSFLSMAIIAIVVAFVFFNQIDIFRAEDSGSIARAGTGDNVSGWAWSENIGWISFNCSNESTCGAVDYGVAIDGTTGTFSGYAWSENIGWVKFDPEGPYPGQRKNSAEVDLDTGEVSGWARACAGAENPDCTGGTNPGSGGWDGWIKMKSHPSDGGADYGVSIGQAIGEFHGWAWGGVVVGWVSFNCQEGGSSGENICGVTVGQGDCNSLYGTGKQTYPIQTDQSKNLQIVRLDVDPIDVKVGELQKITVKVIDKGNSFITSESGVSARIFTDNKTTTIPSSAFKLAKAGDEEVDGIRSLVTLWEGYWEKDDSTCQTYAEEITATNNKGQEAFTTVTFEKIQINYKVVTDSTLFNASPQAINLQDNNTAADYCFVSSPPIILSWQFSDADPEDTQSAYQVQIATNPGFGSLLIDTGKVLSANSEYSPLSLSFGTTYYWRVKVWDNSDEESVPEWAVGVSFTTPSHVYPSSDFTWSPAFPSVEEQITFQDATAFASGSSGQSWVWNFGDTETSILKNPVHVYQENGAYTVVLSAGDDAGSCATQKIINITLPFPEWQEISPF